MCVFVRKTRRQRFVCDVCVTSSAAKQEPASPPVNSQLRSNFCWRSDKGRQGWERLIVAGESLSLSLSSDTHAGICLCLHACLSPLLSDLRCFVLFIKSHLVFSNWLAQTFHSQICTRISFTLSQCLIHPNNTVSHLSHTAYIHDFWKCHITYWAFVPSSKTVNKD